MRNLPDLTKVEAYKNPAPPCTRCKGKHFNYQAIELEGGWGFLCTPCQIVLGYVEAIEIETMLEQARSKKAKKLSFHNEPLSSFLDKVLAL